jgi:hypothetical protein
MFANKVILRNKKNPIYYFPIILTGLRENGMIEVLIDRKNFGLKFINNTNDSILHADPEFWEIVPYFPLNCCDESDIISSRVYLQDGKNVLGCGLHMVFNGQEYNEYNDEKQESFRYLRVPVLLRSQSKDAKTIEDLASGYERPFKIYPAPKDEKKSGMPDVSFFVEHGYGGQSQKVGPVPFQINPKHTGIPSKPLPEGPLTVDDKLTYTVSYDHEKEEGFLIIKMIKDGTMYGGAHPIPYVKPMMNKVPYETVNKVLQKRGIEITEGDLEDLYRLYGHEPFDDDLIEKICRKIFVAQEYKLK